MFEGIGLAPVSVTLDLDTYEGSWTHVQRFRQSSGWITAVRATIQSEHDILTAKLIAACDDRGHPIESWRAEHLTNCEWSELAECIGHPPEVLDDLLCEEEGAFYARWQREMNTDLAALAERAQRRIEALEAKATARSQMLQIQIADLRRRRRMAGVATDVQITINAIIAEIEAEHDTAVARLIDHRAQLRRESDIAEEALWQRTDVLIEFDPIYTVHWTAGQMRAECAPAKVWRCGEFCASPLNFVFKPYSEGEASRLVGLRAALSVARNSKDARVAVAQKITTHANPSAASPHASPQLQTVVTAATPKNSSFDMAAPLQRRRTDTAEQDLAENDAELQRLGFNPADVSNFPAEVLIIERKELYIELRRHERRGAVKNGRLGRFEAYHAAREELLLKIAQLDARIALAVQKANAGS